MFAAWGKTDRREGGNTHSLAHRCMDEAAAFARMTDLPVVRDRLETAADAPLKESVRRRMAALVLLHDIGKPHPGFQSKGWPPELWRGPPCGHLKEGGFLYLAYRQPEHPFHRTMQEVANWGGEAAIAHRGRPVEAPHSPALRDWPRWRTGSDRIRGFSRSPRLSIRPTARAARAAAIRALETIGLDSGALSARPAPDFTALSGFPCPTPPRLRRRGARSPPRREARGRGRTRA